MLLLAHRQLDDAFRRQVAGVQDHLLVGDGSVVDAKAAALDLAARLAVGGDEAGPDEQREHADAGVKFAARNFHRRQVFRDRAFLKSLPRGFGGRVGGIAAVQQRGRLGRQHLLGLVDLAAL